MALISNSPNSLVIGECIYCGVTDVPLSNEHVVPYGLNGEWTLLRASRARCADLTSKFEKDALRGLLPMVRTGLSMRSRRRKVRSATFPLVLDVEGEQRTIQVPVSEFPIYLPSPLFPPIGQQPSVDKAEGEAALEFRHVAGPTFEELARNFYPGVQFIGVRARYSPALFARMLVKIAFCSAIRVLGIAPLRTSGAPAVILGNDQDYGRWVESWPGDPPFETNGLHAIQVHADPSGSELHVLVRLFAQFQAPTYHVALGAVPFDFIRSVQWPWPGNEPCKSVDGPHRR